jgi:hypothetical protein
MDTEMATLLDLKNRLNIRKWEWLRHLRGGSFHVTAHDLVDRRTLDLQERGRRLEVEMREVKRLEEAPVRKLANVAKRRIERARRMA